MWDLFISFALNLLIACLMPGPKPPQAKRYALSDYTVPTTDENRAPPIPYGTVQMVPTVMWFGDYGYTEVAKYVRTNPIRKQRQVIGYQYRIGQWLHIAGAQVDAITEIRSGDHIVWSGPMSPDYGTFTLSQTVKTTLDVNKTWTSSEGQEVQEGMVGRFEFYNQHPVVAPVANTYMCGQLAETVMPAYLGECHAVWLGPSANANYGFCSINNSLPALKFTVQRFPGYSPRVFGTTGTITVGTTSWAVDDPLFSFWCWARSNINGDANIAFIIAELLTSTLPGLGPKLLYRQLNRDTFAACADRLYSEGLGCSFVLDRTRPLSEVLKDLCKQAGAVLELNERTGLMEMRLLRADDPVVYEFNDDNIQSWESFSRISLASAPNEIVVPFIDRNYNWESRSASAQNEAGIAAAGTIISNEVQFIGVANPSVAALLASRELRALGTSLAKGRFTATVPASIVLRVGQLIRVHYSPKNLTVLCRVQSSRFGTYSDRYTVEVEFIEDVFRAGNTQGAYSLTPPSGTSMPAPDGCTKMSQAMFAPWPLNDDPTQLRPMYYAGPPPTNPERASGYRVAFWDDYPWDQRTEANASFNEIYSTPFAAQGVTAASYAFTETGTIQLTMTAENAYVVSKNAGKRVLMMLNFGEEFMYGTAVMTTSTLCTITLEARGALGTIPDIIPAGMAFDLIYGYVIDPIGVTGGRTIAAKPQSVGPGGLGPFPATVPDARWEILPTTYIGAADQLIKPYGPGRVAANGVFGYPGGILSTGQPAIGAGAINITLTGRDRTRTDLNGGYFQIGAFEAGSTAKLTLSYLPTGASPSVPSNWVTWSSNIDVIGGSASIITTGMPTGTIDIRATITVTSPTGGTESWNFYWKRTA